MEKKPLWQRSLQEVFTQLDSGEQGLTDQEASKRLRLYGFNTFKAPSQGKGLILFLSQFNSPLIWLLCSAAVLSMFLGDISNPIIIMSIVLLSGLLGFFQERGAINAVEKLLTLVENDITVVRSGQEKKVSLERVVIGDIIHLSAGDVIPADSMLIEVKHFFVDESSMTGESCPVEKMPGKATEASALKQPHVVFLGTIVASGFAKAIVIATAKDTELSKISEKVRFKPPQTAFEIGVKKFGFFLLQVTIFIVSVIFLLNIYFKKPLIESFLFSTALAVGLTPQLLPVIISINLSRGAKKMAEMKVVVKRLPAIENFGQMNLLCTDKTGTLTLGKTRLESAVDSWGKISEKVAQYAFLNSHFQQGYVNPIDKAILEGKSYSTAGFEKIDEYPYDFERKRLTVVLKNEGRKLLITKGTCAQVLAVCNRIECSDGSVTPFNDHQKEIQKYFEEQSEKGFRALAVAYGDNEEEKDLIFLGLLNFVDPIKPTAVDAIDRLEKKGIKLKVITGDNQLVSKYVAKSVGLPLDSFLTGEELQKISDEELVEVVKKKSVFAEIEPNQKERIIFALKKAGNVIGYMGDGVNDVSALHSADVSIAVDSGADAAKEVADIVLLEKDLHVLNLGVEEGRRTFVNTMKYVYMATSANFGNMFSMAGASLFLPFFPLLPQQVLLTNFLSDFPQTALATDRVDADVVTRPVKWDIPYIRRFMMVFGTLNSVADYLTFAVLLLWLKAGETLFQSGWFVENVVTAALIVFVIRTKKKFWKSKPGVLLCLMILSIAILVPFIPYTSFGALFGFAPIPLIFYPYLAGITAIYFATAEIAKRYFFKKFHSKSSQGGP